MYISVLTNYKFDTGRQQNKTWFENTLDEKDTHIFGMASFPAHGGVAAPSCVPVIAVALHGLPLAPTELAAGLRLTGRAVGPAPAQMTPLADNSIKLFSQTSQILVKVFKLCEVSYFSILGCIRNVINIGKYIFGQKSQNLLMTYWHIPGIRHCP